MFHGCDGARALAESTANIPGNIDITDPVFHLSVTGGLPNKDSRPYPVGHAMGLTYGIVDILVNPGNNTEGKVSIHGAYLREFILQISPIHDWS